MPAPEWIDHGGEMTASRLPHDEVAGGAGLAHEVEDPVVLGEVDVAVDLGAAVVQVRREGVPHRAVGDDGDAELQHRGLQLLAPGVAEEAALVGGAGEPSATGSTSLWLSSVGGVRRVGRRGDEVEGGLGAGEGDLAPAADEEAVEVVELELLAVDEDVAGAADVDDAELAALEVGLGAEHVVQAGRSSWPVPGTAPPMTSRSSWV